MEIEKVLEVGSPILSTGFGPWEKNSASLNIGLLIAKMGIMMIPFHRAIGKGKQVMLRQLV